MKSSKAYWGEALGVLLAGLVFLTILLNNANSAIEIRVHGITAEAMIVDFATKGSYRFFVSRPVVEFTAQDYGNPVRAELSQYGGLDSPRIGQRVKIVYLSTDPTRVIASSHNPSKFGLPGVVASLISGLGLALLLISILRSPRGKWVALAWTGGWILFWAIAAIINPAGFYKMYLTGTQLWMIYPLTTIGTWLLWPVLLVMLLVG